MSNELIEDLTETFPPIEIALPTRGIFYPSGILNPTADAKRIQVHTLGMMDEYKYRDPFLLVSGKAIDHLVHHICGEQIMSPEDLCEIDVETILVAARLASYGPDLKVKHKCMRSSVEEGKQDQPCAHENTVQINLHEFILRYEPIQNEEQYEVTLPRVGQTVYLKPIPYRTTIELMRNVMATQQSMDDLNLSDQTMRPEDYGPYEEILNRRADLQVKALLDCIWAVKTRSGKMIEDPEMIAQWIFELPNSDHDVITRRLTELTNEFRQISLIRYLCGQCGGENQFNLQMNSEILFLAESEDSAVPATFSDMPTKNKGTSRTPSRISRRPPSTSPGR